MKSITIHGIEEPLVALIKSKAESEGLSVNKTIKKILEESLGVRPQNHNRKRKEFEEFSGFWSQSDLDEFNRNTQELNEVDPGDWQ